LVKIKLINGIYFFVLFLGLFRPNYVFGQQNKNKEDQVREEIRKITLAYPLWLSTEQAVQAFGKLIDEENIETIDKLTFPYQGTGTRLVANIATFLKQRKLSAALLRTQRDILVTLSTIDEFALKRIDETRKIKVKSLALDNNVKSVIELINSYDDPIHLLVFNALCEIGERNPEILIDTLEDQDISDNKLTLISLALVTTGNRGLEAINKRILEKNIIAPGLIRSLGLFNSNRHMEILISRMDNSQLIGECADGLAILGDPKAIPALKDKLSKSDSSLLKAPLIRAISYCLSVNIEYSFKPYLESNSEIVKQEAILAAGRTKESACVESIISIMKSSSYSWNTRGAAAESYAAIAPQKAADAVLEVLLAELNAKNMDTVELDCFKSFIVRALSFCWKDDLHQAIIKLIEVPRCLNNDELDIYLMIIKNTSEEFWLAPLIKSYIRNLSKDQTRQNIAQLIARLEKKILSLPFHLLLLMDNSEKIRTEAYSYMVEFVKERWLKNYDPNLSPIKNKEVISKALSAVIEEKRYFYYSRIEHIANWYTKLDQDAIKEATPINPYTRKPLTEEQMKMLREEETKLNKLLNQVREKQEETWEKHKDANKGKDANENK